MNACSNEIWQICLRNIILNYTVEVGLKPTPSGFRKSCHTVTGALASHADVLRGSSRVSASQTSAEPKDKFLSLCSQISDGDHIQIIGDPIGAVEVKVLTNTHVQAR